MNVMKMMTAGAMALALASCGTNKQATVTDLAGEWDVVTINGVSAGSETIPYMGFDLKDGRIYGHAGCNRITGALDKEAAPGVISFDKMATTRMMCQDMSVETALLGMLRDVKGYKFAGKEAIALTDASGKTIGKMQKRGGAMKASALQGEWKILNVKGVPATSSLETTPTIWFDTKEKLTHGNASCNSFHGGYGLDKGQSLKFSQMASTMKFCSEMTFEQKLFEALDEVRSFGKMHGGKVGLFDEDGQLVIELVR